MPTGPRAPGSRSWTTTPTPGRSSRRPSGTSRRRRSSASKGQTLDKSAVDTFQFHQVSVWALLQCALAFFEDPSALGRSIPWAFEGNRLIVVPHAGYGENAFYDRDSKSLQFYYFGSDGETVYTCLSTDIVNHEFGHAVLDGMRPLFNESTRPADRRLPRVHGRPVGDPADAEEQDAAPAAGPDGGGQVREGDDAVVAGRGVRPGRGRPAVPAHGAQRQERWATWRTRSTTSRRC